MTLVPILSEQAQDLVNHFPTWQRSADQQVRTLHDWLQSLGIAIDIRGMTAELGNQLSKQLQAIATRVPELLEGSISSIFELFLVIVVIVYLLLKGEGLWNGIFEWLPGKLGRR